MKGSRSGRVREIFDTYTGDLSREDFERLFTHDTPDAYRFFARGLNEDLLIGLPAWKRVPLRIRQIFVAFTLRLPPARRALYIAALCIALLGLVRLFRGFGQVDVPFGVPFFQIAVLIPVWADGTFALLLSLFLVNLLVLLEVADRLSLKGELEVAREIQLAMLPSGTPAQPGLALHHALLRRLRTRHRGTDLRERGPDAAAPEAAGRPVRAPRQHRRGARHVRGIVLRRRRHAAGSRGHARPL